MVADLPGIALILAITVVAGVIAYIGDRVGHQVGRKRLTLFGLRPKYTSTIVAVATGMLIALSVTLVALIGSQQVRTAFFRLGQINAHINETLVSRAVELLDLTPSSSVLDLFCGIGNFTLPLARKAGRVVGVEGEQGLVERARHNARLNDICNAEFHVADLGRAPESGLPWLRDNYTHVLLDPPRAGAAEVLAAVSRLNPRRVLYISCHPGSLARDLGLLVHEHGMKLVAAGVLDMFPHTTHVESLALLEPKGRME